MKSLLTALFRRKPSTIRNPRPARRLGLEPMEDRITPANVWVSTNSSSTQEVVREYTPSGSLLQTVVIPASGPTDEDARDLSVVADGTVHVYNGTFDPVLSTYSAAGTWSSRTFAGWSTVNNGSYGGIARSGNYVFVTDMNTGSGDDPLKGIIRFNLADGTATRFATSVDPTDLAVGQNGRLYALDSYGDALVYHPETLALEQIVDLPYTIGGVYQDNRSITANAAGELFVATWGNQVHRFSPAGVLQSTLTLPTASINNLTDIDLAADGTLAIGSRFGVVALTTEGFATPTYLTVGTSSNTFVAFREDPPAPPVPLPGFSVTDVTVTEGNSGTTTATFSVTLSQPLAQAATVYYSTSSGTALGGTDFTSSAAYLNFAPGETTKTVSITVNGDATYEPDETFTVNLSYASANASIIDPQGVGTIVNDDPVPPALSVGDVTVTEGNSGTSLATFTITLSFASAQSVGVNYSTSSGTASSVSDFTSASGAITFAPGQTSKTVTVSVTGDTAYEPNETFYLNLSSPTNALIGDGQGVATILNDDAAPPAIAVGDVTVTEGNGGTALATFTVSLSYASASAVSVSYATANGTASSASDYTSTNGSLSFAPGETSKTLTVSVTGDTTYEPNETFYLNLSGATGATIADSQGVATITNDDAAPTIAVDDVTVTEGNSGFTYFNFTVTLSSASSQTVTVGYATAGGTAITGSDFVSRSGSLTFSAGQTSKTVQVPVYGDTTVEPNETFYLNLSGATNATIADAQGVCTIANDDTPPIPTIQLNDVMVTEGGIGGVVTPSFSVTLSAASTQTITVNYTTTPGTATAGSDFGAVSGTLTFAPGEFVKAVPVSVFGDAEVEGNEVFYLDLSGAVNATIADSRGTGTINNDDTGVPPTISVNDVTLVETNSGTTYAAFRVALSASAPTQVTVNYATADGTAAAGSDYATTTGTLTFTPGTVGIYVLVPVYGDTAYEPNETFYLNLSGATNATIADSQGVATITNDDTSASLAVNDVTVTEGNSGTTNATFTVTLSQAAAQTVTVNYTTTAGSASPGTDYTGTGGTLTFAPGETAKTVTVSVLGDTAVESNEIFYFDLSSPVNATLGDWYGVGTITNDDVYPNLAIAAPTVTEGDAGTTQAVFTLTLSQASAQPVTLNYATTAGSAASGTDYAPASGSLTFAPGETTKTVSVDVLGDVTDESNETFTLTLSNLTNVGTVTGSGQATITDDDAATLSVNDVTLTEGNSGTTTATFTVTLSTPSSTTVTANYAFAPGTATSGSDYTTNGSVLVSFSPGQTTRTVTVTVLGDTTPEADETFFLNLSNPSGAAIADAQGVGTILDDEPPVINAADVTTSEGDTGTTPAVFTLTLSKPSAVPVTVNYRVHGVTATDNVDLLIETGTVTFAPGETSKSVTVTIYGDTLTEPGETYQLILSGPTNATLARDSAYGTIANDDATPTLSVNDPFVGEGNSGTTPMTFTVSLTSAAAETVTVDYATADLPNNAVAGVDYLAASGTLTFAPGETTKTVTVTLLGDTLEEWTEQLHLNLSNPVGAPVADAQGMGYIANDDTARFTVDDTSVVEGDSGTTYAAITVRLTNPSIRSLYVNYATSGSDAMLVPGVDYTPTSGTLTFAPGETAKTVLVAVIGDVTDEPNETFSLNLSGPTNASILDNRGNCTIIDDETATYSVADVTVTETDTTGQWVTVTITASHPNSRPDVLSYSVVAGTATAGADFGTAGGTLNWAIGETVKTISVYVYGDTADEPDETALVNISGPFYGVVGDGQGVITIVDNDLPPAPPVAEAGPPTMTVGEGQVVTFDGSASSDPNGGPLSYAWDFGTGVPWHGAVVQYPFADNGTYTVTLTVTDNTGLSSTDTITVTVENLVSPAYIAGLGTAVRGEPTPYVVSANDPSSIDQAANFTYQISWGDGATQTVVGPGQGVTVHHAYPATGTYTMSVTATDKDGATGPAATKAVEAVAVAVQGTNLVVGGTTGNDQITVTQVSGFGATVEVNGQNLGTFSFGSPSPAPPAGGGVVVYAQDGNDTVTLVGMDFGSTVEFTRAAMLFGGDGNDVLDASASTVLAVLLGGAGADDLRGGSGRDILIGGVGADALTAGGGEDILIGGTTDFDNDFDGLASISAEWARTDVSRATRVQHLKGESAGGYNGTRYLTPATVHDDGTADTLHGGADADWVFLAISTDTDTDVTGDDLVTAL